MPGETSPLEVIWCLGMYASGSTWLFNAARQVAGCLADGPDLPGAFAETLEQLQHLPPGRMAVKTHHLGAAETMFMEARAERILLSLRDPRDAVTSMMQHMGQSFLQALDWVEQSALYSARFAGGPRTSLFIYESGFTEDEATFDRLAAALGSELAAAARARLFAQTRRGAIEAHIARLESLPTSWHNPANNDMVDTATQWHRHHAGRSGEIGRWRRLMPEKGVRIIEKRLAGFMRDFGYLTGE